MAFKNSILDPCTCGFAKVAAYVAFTQSKVKESVGGKYEYLRGLFLKTLTDSKNFEVDVKVFTRFSSIVNNIKSLGKTYPESRKDVMNFFSAESLKALTETDKSKHKLFDCEGCIGSWLYKSKLAKFQTKEKNRNFVLKAIENGLNVVEEAKEATQEIIQNLDKHYLKKYKTTFTEIAKLPSLPSATLSKKQKVKERNNLAKEINSETKEQWGETSVERYTFKST